MKPAELGLIPLLFTLFSCASIMTGSTDTVTITSTPSGARFSTNTGVRGRTPMSVSVPASQDLVVEYSLPGYEPQGVVLESRMSAWVIGNIVFGGLIGLVIDVVNPDSRTHDSVVDVQLLPSERPMDDEVDVAGVDEEAVKTQPVDFPQPPREIEIRHRY